jgi:CRISPR-associated protein Cmr4
MLEKEAEWHLPEKLEKKLPEQVKNRTVLVSTKLLSQIVNSNLEVRTSVAINPETGTAEEGALFTYEAIPRATVLWFDVVVDDFRGSFPDSERLSMWENILKNGSDKEKEKLLKNWKLLKEKENSEKLDEAIQKAQRWIKDEKFTDKDVEKWKWERMKCDNTDKEDILCIIDSGLKWAEHLGIGGMGTRGFGRVKVIEGWEVVDHE